MNCSIQFETMNYKQTIAALFTLIFFSCGSSNGETEKTSTMQEQTQQTATEANKYKDVAFDSKKDLVCGMPVTAGVSDTIHYKEKVYGFCSKDCKDEFVKNPSAFIAEK